MEIPVLIEPVAGNGFRVSGMTPFPFTVEGETKDAALQKVHALVAQRVSQGAEVATVTVNPSRAPWAEFAGALRDDPLLDAWTAAIEEYRRQRDPEDVGSP
jgi:hypothetical protein